MVEVAVPQTLLTMKRPVQEYRVSDTGGDDRIFKGGACTKAGDKVLQTFCGGFDFHPLHLEHRLGVIDRPLGYSPLTGRGPARKL